ncbi:MAG: hypothetical protein ABIO04_01640 [Ferruginibacter sp.]
MQLKKILEKFYDARNLAFIQSASNKDYVLAGNYLASCISKWEKLITDFKQTSDIKGLRQFPVFPPNLKVSLGIDEKQSITIHINFLIFKIGVIFCSYEDKARIPIVNRSHEVLSSLSYYPFNEQQEKFAQMVINKVQKTFPVVEVFNNFYASTKARNVIIDQVIVEEVDSYQVIFDDNLHGFF